MTSKTSLRKLIRIDMAQRSWLLVVMSVACAIMLPVSLAMRLPNAAYYGMPLSASEAEMVLAGKQYAFAEILGGRNFLVLAGVLVAAALAAVSGYAFLHKKEKIDFFHSLPIRREKLFFVPFISGAILTVLPYVASVLISVAIGAGAKILTAELVRNALLVMLVLVISFFAIYAVLILGMVLSGRTVVGAIFGVFLIAIGPLVFLLGRTLMAMSFQTYWSGTAESNRWAVLSPASLMGQLASRANGGTLSIVPLLVQLGFLAAGIALSVFFYKKRPSEAAENALIFSKMQPFLKGAIVVPGALLVGLFFFTAQNSLVWLIVGALIGAFLLSWALDAIFDKDVRAIASHKRSTALVIGLAAACLVFFAFDTVGFDRYLPEKEEIESMALQSDGMFRDLGGFYTYDAEGARALLEASQTKDFAPIYELAAEGVANVRRFEPYEPIDQPGEGEASEADYADHIVVSYRLKDGHEIIRQYRVSHKKVEATSRALSESAAFREAAYPTAFMIPDDLADCTLVEDPDSYTGIEDKEIGLSVSERAELLRLIQEEAGARTLDELAEGGYVGCLMLNAAYDESRPYVCYNLLLYPQYEKTLAFLEGKGFALGEG